MAKTIALLLLGAALLLNTGCGDLGIDRKPERITSYRKTKALEKEKRLDVNISYGGGHMTLSPADPGVLYNLELEYDANTTTPVYNYSDAGGRGRLEFQMESHRGIHKVDRLDLTLTDGLPLDLQLKTGVSESKVDLSGMQVQRLNVAGGVGQTVLSFTKANPIVCEQIRIQSGVGEFKVVGLGNANPDRLLFEGGIGSAHLDLTGLWKRNAELEMRLGIGEVTLVAPQEIGIEIEGHKGFLSSMHLTDFDKYNDRYRSRNYSKAQYRLVVRINTGIGSLHVRWA